MLSSSDLSMMRDTEELAMSSTGTVYRKTLSSTPWGNQEESFSAVGTVSCDIWPIERIQTSMSQQDLTKGHFYISFPYDADIQLEDVIDISGQQYQIYFVPQNMSWLTNLRCEAFNFNLTLT